MTDHNTHSHGTRRRNDAPEAEPGVYERATAALGQSRDAAANAARRTAQGIEANPLGILVGGLAVGVLAGALLPRSDRERALLAPVGQRLGETARAAAAAAREAGKAELVDRGLSRDAARDQVRGLFDNVTKVLASAGGAAFKATGSANRGASDEG